MPKPQSAVDDFAAIIASAQDPQPCEEDPPLVGREDLPQLFTMATAGKGHVKSADERRDFQRRAEALEKEIDELSHGT